MKKFLAVLLALMMVFSFAACGGSSSDDTDVMDISDVPDVATAGDEELIEPSVEWWGIQTNRGFPIFVAEVYNPNDVDVDFSCDVEYFKGGESIGTFTDLYYNCLESNQPGMLYNTWDVPEGVDDIKVTFTQLAESYYEPVAISIREEAEHGDYFQIEYNVDGDFYSAAIGTVFICAGEIVAAGIYDVIDPQEDCVEIEMLGQRYDDYMVYTNAYKAR